MKHFKRALAIAAIAIMPATAQAQFDVQLNVLGQTINAGPNGGQFSATASGLGNLLVYCIDPFRNITFNVSNTYRVFTFAQYVAATLPGGVGGFTNSQNLDDVNTMGKNAQTIAANGVSVASDNAQNNTWDIFRGTVNGTSQPNFSNTNWYVLVSVDAIDSRTGVAGTQTFITTTAPEPSTYVLLAVGMAGIAAVSARRRRQA